MNAGGTSKTKAFTAILCAMALLIAGAEPQFAQKEPHDVPRPKAQDVYDVFNEDGSIKTEGQKVKAAEKEAKRIEDIRKGARRPGDVVHVQDPDLEDRLFGNARVETIVALPTAPEQFQSVFGRNPTVKDESQIRRAAAEMRRYGLTQNDSASAGNIESLIIQSAARYVVLVGHNDHGQFVFVDKSKRSLASIADLAKRNRKVAIIISCEATAHVKKITDISIATAGAGNSIIGDAYATSTSLNLLAGVQIAAAVKEYIESRHFGTDSSSLEQFLATIEQKTQRSVTVRRVSVAVASVGGSLIVVMLIVQLLEDEKARLSLPRNHSN